MTAALASRAVKRVFNAVSLLEGGGFPVRRPVGMGSDDLFDPFLMLDHLGPITYPPGEAILAPDHPHRGMQTVSYLLEGGIHHLDSFGHEGTLTKGGVQWMNAGSGLIHSEMPSTELLEKGGTMSGFQLWVNLPASAKMSPPDYQELTEAEIPTASSDDAKVKVKVISGTATSFKVSSAIKTHSPILFLDVIMQSGATFQQEIPSGFNAFIYVYDGRVTAGSNDKAVVESQAAVIDTDGAGLVDTIRVQTSPDNGGKFLLIAGKPLKEPIKRQGPFVMNTAQELRQAFVDYSNGKMGFLEGADERRRLTDRAHELKSERLRKQALMSKKSEL